MTFLSKNSAAVSVFVTVTLVVVVSLFVSWIEVHHAAFCALGVLAWEVDQNRLKAGGC